MSLICQGRFFLEPNSGSKKNRERARVDEHLLNWKISIQTTSSSEKSSEKSCKVRIYSFSLYIWKLWIITTRAHTSADMKNSIIFSYSDQIIELKLDTKLLSSNFVLVLSQRDKIIIDFTDFLFLLFLLLNCRRCAMDLLRSRRNPYSRAIAFWRARWVRFAYFSLNYEAWWIRMIGRQRSAGKRQGSCFFFLIALAFTSQMQETCRSSSAKSGQTTDKRGERDSEVHLFFLKNHSLVQYLKK